MREEVVISVRDVSKKYRLFSSPQERLKEALHPFSKRYHKEFWALDGLNLEVRRGQTVGILGRNGCGKSTLLQIIAGVMQPTSGTVLVNGRVSALLELGSGFNPDFTGRENVLFQSQVMGISRNQIKHRLPEIEAFADIGEFFDQPVKTYSSGMFMRVAFAAAINVDPDILIVDEALSVGDAKFQHKCFDRFAIFQQQGKTILFVSHNVNLVSNHCDRVMLLDGGRLISDGAPTKVVDEYLKLLFGHGAITKELDEKKLSADSLAIGESDDDLHSRFMSQSSSDDSCESRSGYNPGETRIGDRSAEIIDYTIATLSDSDVNVIRSGSQMRLLIKAKFHRQIKRPIVGFAMKTVDGIEIYGTNTFMLGIDVKKAGPDEVRVFQFSFQPLFVPGDYFIDIGVAEMDGTPGGSVVDIRRSIVHVTIVGDKIAFNGLVNLAPLFVDLSEAEIRPIESFA